MRHNRGVTLLEVIIVISSISGVMLFFWTILNSATKDTHTINSKIEVQTSVTLLMNIIQQDIQEAKIYNISATETGIVANKVEDVYSFAEEKISYIFDSESMTVTRNKDGTTSVYNNILDFSMTPTKKERYGAEVHIIGGKTKEAEDRSRYELSSTFYTRNTR